MQETVCPDCGMVPVNHSHEKFGVEVDWLMSPFNFLMGGITRALMPVITIFPWEKTALPIFTTMSLLGMGTLHREPDDKLNLRSRAMWESAEKRGIKITEFRLLGRSQSSFFVARKGRKVVVFDGLPRPKWGSDRSLDYMDDKGAIKKKFSRAGIPVPKGKSCFLKYTARKTFKKVGAPVIIKPNIGSRSRHTYIHIMDEQNLEEKFRKAKMLSPWVVVEEQMQGGVYRGSVICGELAGVLRRDSAFVTGDGKSTVKKLVQKENRNPARRGPIFHTIPMDADAEKELARQNLTWQSVPKKGQVVSINQKVTRTLGASTTDVTDIVHPDNAEILEEAAKLIKASLVGIDFMIPDISASWKKQERCGIIECNSMPFLDLHHYPLYGRPRDVAGMLWDKIFS